MSPTSQEPTAPTGRAAHVNIELLERELARLELELSDARSAFELAQAEYGYADARLEAVKVMLRIGREYVERGEITRPDY